MNMPLRPSWDQYFLGLAFLVSSRSRDESTKHGCFIVDGDYLPLGFGYNSWIRGIDDSKIPQTRPEKYAYVRHSEENALLNCKMSPRMFEGVTAYVTGQCCNDCFQRMYQAGIKRLVMARRHGTYLLDEESKKVYDFLLNQTKGKIKVEYVDFDFDWVIQYFEFLKNEKK